MIYFWYMLGAFALATLLTPVVRRLAIKTQSIDIPRPPRNLHTSPVPKLGGLAVFLSFAIVTLFFMAVSERFDHYVVPFKFIWAILGGGLVLAIGGFLDDKYNLPAKALWAFPFLASIIIVGSGIGVGIKYLSNPLGDPISLAFSVAGIPASALVIILWLNGMMYTTKFLDGLDGLVAGIGIIAGLSIFALLLTDRVNQPITASLAIIFAGALAGYLIYAFHPASIFLGEGGSTFVGFILGVLAVITGAKIATALLVMGIPILDVAWVIAQRLWSRKSPFRGDRLHLHFKLLDLGFTQKQTALVLYALSAAFGFTAVFLQSMGKLIALILLLVIMGGFILALLFASRRKAPSVDKTGSVL